MHKKIYPILTAMLAVFLLCNAVLPTHALTNEDIVNVESKRKRGGSKKNYTYVTVIWNSDGGTKISPWKVRTDKPITKLPSPKKNGYTLEGWYTAKTGGSKISESTVVKKNSTFYARWKASSSTTPKPTATPKPTVTPKPTATPKPKNGWEGKKYYVNGKMTTGQKKIGNYWYWLDLKTGEVAKNKTINIPASATSNKVAKTCRYDKDGHMVYGLQTIGSDKYYFDKSTGAMAKYKEVKINDKWYFFYSDGKMWKGFKYFPDTKQWKYYLKRDGSRAHGQHKLVDDAIMKDKKEYWYWADPKTGVLAMKKFINIPEEYNSASAKTCWYDGYGHMVYGQRQINGYWYYFNEGNGAMLKDQWKWIGNQSKLVLYQANGRMAKGTVKYKGVTYKFSESTGKVIPKNTIKTGWDAETDAIINAHRYDFNEKTYSAVMKAHGGYQNWIKSLGGVFAQYQGKKNLNITKISEVKPLMKYIYGLQAIVGFDYGGYDPAAYKKWGGGSGTDDRFYISTSKYRGGYDSHHNYNNLFIDEIVGNKGAGMTTACQGGPSFFGRQAGLIPYGRDTSGVANYIKNGAKVITQMKDLQPGDFVYCSNKTIPYADKVNFRYNYDKYCNHTSIVGERDYTNNTVTLYESGSWFTNKRNPRLTRKVGSQTLHPWYKDWVAVRIRQLK